MSKTFDQCATVKEVRSHLSSLLDDDLGYRFAFDLYQLSVRVEARIPYARRNSADDAFFQEMLLEFLFSRGLLPSYAFPTDLTSFLVERLVRQPNAQQWKMEIIERPQQGINKALSEYAPGRLIVIEELPTKVAFLGPT